MRNFFGQTSGGCSLRVTLVLVGLFCVLLVAAFMIGISGNRAGLMLCYLASCTLILSFAHTWRNRRKFIVLFVVSLLGFPVFVLLHNLFYALNELASGVTVLNCLLEFLHAAFFLVAILLCPAGAVVGAAGGIIASVAAFRKQRRTPRAG